MIFNPGHVLAAAAVIAIALGAAYIAETRTTRRRNSLDDESAAGSWEWDDQATDSREIWRTADQPSIDAAFLVIADITTTTDFADIIRRHAEEDR